MAGTDETKVSQCEYILKYLELYGSITPLEALREFGCMRLASRIWDLTQKGYRFKVTMTDGVGRLGNKTRYATYRLEA